MDSTRAISEGTGEKDTKKALEFRRKEVGIGIDNSIGSDHMYFILINKAEVILSLIVVLLS